MTNKTKFFIIVPTLNSYKDLNKFCISLKTQTHKEWRVVFVDGQSSKKHKNFIRSLCIDKRFKVIEEENFSRGIYQSMTYGMEFANEEEWVIFLGSDDWFSSPFSLEIMDKEIMQLNGLKKFNLLLYGTKFVQKKTSNILRINNIPYIVRRNFSKLLFLGYMPMHHSACFSFDLIKKHMPYDSNYNLAADCDLFLRISKNKKLSIKYVDKILINIQGGGISSTSTFKRIYEVISIYIKYYGISFFIPFGMRYIRKIISRFKCFFLSSKSLLLK